MAASVKVYGPVDSPPVSRVLACLFEKDVPFQLIPMAQGDHKKPDFLKIQPLGQFPGFQDGDVSLFESRAICRYISEKYLDQGNKTLYGTNPLAKASIDQWLEAEGQSFNPPSTYLISLAVNPSYKTMKPWQLEGQIKQGEDKLADVLDVYEKTLNASRYLAGDDFTLADLSHLPNTHLLMKKTGSGRLFISRKNVGRWWRDISNRESWKKVIDMQMQY